MTTISIVASFATAAAQMEPSAVGGRIHAEAHGRYLWSLHETRIGPRRCATKVFARDVDGGGEFRLTASVTCDGKQVATPVVLGTWYSPRDGNENRSGTGRVSFMVSCYQETSVAAQSAKASSRYGSIEMTYAWLTC